MPDRLGDQIRLQHTIDAIAEIRSFIEGLDFEGFSKSSLIKSACIRQLEIIGEACNRISEELKNENPDVPWRQVVGLRNVLIHQYFGVDEQIIWDVIQKEMLMLESRAKEIMDDFKND